MCGRKFLLLPINSKVLSQLSRLRKRSQTEFERKRRMLRFSRFRSLMEARGQLKFFADRSEENGGKRKFAIRSDGRSKPDIVESKSKRESSQFSKSAKLPA